MAKMIVLPKNLLPVSVINTVQLAISQINPLFIAPPEAQTAVDLEPNREQPDWDIPENPVGPRPEKVKVEKEQVGEPSKKTSAPAPPEPDAGGKPPENPIKPEPATPEPPAPSPPTIKEPSNSTDGEGEGDSGEPSDTEGDSKPGGAGKPSGSAGGGDHPDDNDPEDVDGDTDPDDEEDEIDGESQPGEEDTDPLSKGGGTTGSNKPSTYKPSEAITEEDIIDAVKKAKEESLAKEIARPGNLENKKEEEKDPLTKNSKNPDGSESTEADRMKKDVPELLKQMAKENPNTLAPIKETIDQIKEGAKNLIPEKIKRGIGNGGGLSNEELTAVLNGGRDPMSSCGAGIYSKFAKIVGGTKEVYVMDKFSRKVEGLFGGEEISQSKAFGTLLAIVDVSGSMNRDLLARIINQSFANLLKIDKHVKLDMIIFADQVAHVKDIKCDRTAIRTVLNTRVGNGTQQDKVIELMKKMNMRPKGILIASDFEFWAAGGQTHWNQHMYKQYSKVPILNLAIGSSYQAIYRYIKDYKPTKYHLWCMLTDGE